jgi:hypothetical protein
MEGRTGKVLRMSALDVSVRALTVRRKMGIVKTNDRNGEESKADEAD